MNFHYIHAGPGHVRVSKQMTSGEESSSVVQSLRTGCTYCLVPLLCIVWAVVNLS